MTRAELAVAAFGEMHPSGIDFALPQEFIREMRDWQIDVTFIVWSYRPEHKNTTFGAPVHLLEQIYKKKGIAR